MKYVNKIVLALLVMLGFSEAFASDPTTADGVVTNAQAIAATATTTYIGGAVLGLGMLTVGIVIYALRRGVKTR